jgi:hypothetical protein
VVVVADEPNEIARLVEQHLRELLSEEGGLQRFLESGRLLRGEGALEVSVGLTADGYVTKAADPVGITDSGDVVLTPGPAVLVLEGASPRLAIDIKDRSPRDIKLAIDFWNAFWVAVTAGVTLWGIVHPQQPLPQEQIMQIFNHATTVVHQTINMPPPPRP